MTLLGRLAWDLLEQRRRRGKMTPVPVESGPLPERAGRVIAADIEWLIGVQLAADYPLKLPCSVSTAVTRGRAEDQSTANEALRTLVGLGVLRCAGTLTPQRPGLPGTKLYAPPERPPVKAQPLLPAAAGLRLLVDALGTEWAVVAACAAAHDATEITGEVVAR